MFLNLTFVAARTLELRGNQDALAAAEGILKEFSSVKAVEDTQIVNEQYVLQTDDLSFNAEDKTILKDLLSLTSAFKEMPRNMKDILNTVSMATADPDAELKTGAYSFAIFFTNDADHIKKLKGVEANSALRLFLSTKKSEADDLGVPFPGMMAYSALDKNSFTGPIPLNYQSLLASLSVASFTVINQENFRFLQTIDQKLFYVIDNKKSYEENKALFNTDAKKSASFARFLFFVPEDVPALIPLLHVEDSDYPVLVSLAKEGKGIVKKLTGENFLESVQKLMTNQAEKLVFSSIIPSDNETSPVKVINTETLSTFTDGSKQDSLLVFSSPSCKFCAALEPVLKKLGQALLDKKIDISIGVYNVIENEEPVGYELNGVPALYFFKKGTDAKMELPEGSRTLEGLLSFIAKEGVSAKVNVEDFAEVLTTPKAEPKEEEKKEESMESSTHEGDDIGAEAL